MHDLPPEGLGRGDLARGHGRRPRRHFPRKKRTSPRFRVDFTNLLSLSSANVDEVIQSRLLAKRRDVKDDLCDVFRRQGDILKNQISFTDCGMTFKQYRDEADFAANYPFAPYQFQLVQKIFEAIRRVGATGAHLARGERSMLDAFQSAAKTVSASKVGVLVPLYDFYPAIESFLDTAVKKTIDQAETNPSLQEFDIKLLQSLFLIRYVDEMKGNVNNLVTLCLDWIDCDRLALRHRIEESLSRLEKQTLINRNGDVYFFLTNEERDISKEIKQVDLSGAEESGAIGENVFEDVLKGQRKHRYSVNAKNLDFNRRCDQFPIGQQKDGALLISLLTPLGDMYEGYEKARAILDSTAEGGCAIVKMGNDEALGRELRRYLQTEKYVRRKNDGTLPETTKRILRDRSEENAERRNRLTAMLGEMFASAEFFVNGQSLAIKAKTSARRTRRGDGISCPEHILEDGVSSPSDGGAAEGNPGRPSLQRRRQGDPVPAIAAEQSAGPGRSEGLSPALRAEEPSGRPERNAGKAVFVASFRLA